MPARSLCLLRRVGGWRRKSGRVARNARIPLPTRKEGYSRVMLVGTTGAGKTTLLRHIIGTDHVRDRFPATSTARTTIADMEIVIAPGPYDAVVTFTPETHHTRSY